MGISTNFSSITLPAVTKTASFDLSEDDAGKTIVIDAAAGLTGKLPLATGSGRKYTFAIKTAVTSNAVILRVHTASEIWAGMATLAESVIGVPKAFPCNGTKNAVSLAGTTNGGKSGDMLEVVDIADGLWAVKFTGSVDATASSPFSTVI